MKVFSSLTVLAVAALFLTFSNSAARAQSLPRLENNSLVNAADGSTPSGACIASLYGTDLATGTYFASNQSTINLGGTIVYINGVAAKLFFVSPLQINLYFVPPAGVTEVTVQVKRGDTFGNTSLSTVTAVIKGGFRFFTVTQNGHGEAAATHHFKNAKFGSQAVTKLTPAALGDYIEFYGTGLPSETVGLFLKVNGRVVDPPAYMGKQGGYLGLDQINLQIEDWMLPTSSVGQISVSICSAFSCTEPVWIWATQNVAPAP